MFIANPFLGIGIYLATGVSFWTVVGVAIAKSMVFTTFLYFGTGWIVILMEKRQFSKRILFYWQLVHDYLMNNSMKPGCQTGKKILCWLLKERKWIVISVSFIPILPFFSHSTIIALRLMRVKYGLLILYAGVILKSVIACWMLSRMIPNL
ncbi:MAG: hypothetical protein U9Q96_01610 [Patescibacteria group bacterium]|nr:hypothetical protein [Patescibacteria group bacterium]